MFCEKYVLGNTLKCFGKIQIGKFNCIPNNSQTRDECENMNKMRNNLNIKRNQYMKFEKDKKRNTHKNHIN